MSFCPPSNHSSMSGITHHPTEIGSSHSTQVNVCSSRSSGASSSTVKPRRSDHSFTTNRLLLPIGHHIRERCVRIGPLATLRFGVAGRQHDELPVLVVTHGGQFPDLVATL